MHGMPGAPRVTDDDAAYLAAIVNASADAIFGTTTDGIVRSWNAACERMLGYSAAEMIGQSILDIVPPELKREALAIRDRVSSGDPIESFETVRLAKDGRPIEVAITYSPIHDGQGQVIGVSGILRDVTTIKTAQRSAAMLAAIVASSSDGVVSKTLDGTVTSWNKSAERIFGFSEGEMINRSIRTIIPGERQAEEDRILATVVSGQIIDNFETVRLRKDGALIDVSVTVSPVRDSTGRIIGASKIVRDITDKRQTREQLRTLLAEVNHRSKNMLSLVQAIARQMTRHGRQLDLNRFLERLQAIAGNQDLLIQNDWRFIPIADLVRSQLGAFRDLIGNRITIAGPQIELTPEAAQAIGMAVHELATNAAKYGALSGDEGRIALNWSCDGDDFDMSWHESDGPPVTVPEQRGFGSRVISDMVRAGLDAAVEVDFAPTGLRWHLRCPLQRLSRSNNHARR
ncbi:putative two-component sensor histidine kinase with PAS/PAC domains [Bradyrhizobium sp. ORS 285]|uniref:sensor histidine kinase n=1 Tax=Bradyrhizobium sp. ORS 285 TaxID=115808 RepID=UPI0002405CE7|nr:PAS domain S-box protein [Bradyrhizobium sp. ORS 285]CCD90068.1 putative two-component sensor histidine kinase with PAS/PAC domains [Bradyrhizobium sp. ORS 285]SMX61645.1 putative two-component sensor histidine kinase with PAS/PAC domains [Bradyrhizobium sp. ORS 285]